MQDEEVADAPVEVLFDPLAFETENLSTIALSEYDQQEYEQKLARSVANTRAGLDEVEGKLATTTKIVVGSTFALSVGVSSWFLKVGSLMSTMLSSMPLWKRFDPMPVLSLSARERKAKLKTLKNIEDDENQSDEKVTRILDSHKSPKQERTGKTEDS